MHKIADKTNYLPDVPDAGLDQCETYFPHLDYPRYSADLEKSAQEHQSAWIAVSPLFDKAALTLALVYFVQIGWLSP